jgi:hypothetical protein
VAITRLILFLLACSSLAFPCDNPQLRSAVIGGHVIQGSTGADQKPLRHVRVRLFSANKLIWSGTTDKEGNFTIHDVPSGKYRLSLAGWGAVNIELKRKLDTSGTGQEAFWGVILLKDNCVGIYLKED